MTAPFDPRALTDLPTTLGSTCQVTALTAEGVPIETLDVSSLVLTLDEGWSPLAQAEMTLTSADPARLDPRTGVRCAIDLGYRYAGGTLDQHRVADLRMHEWGSMEPAGTISAAALGDEMRLQEWVPLGDPRTFPVGSSVVAIITTLLATSIGVVALVSTHRTIGLAEPLTVGPGTRLWAVIESLASQADVWVYADPLGTWHVADRPTTLGPSAVAVTTGPTGITTAVESGMTRTEWGNTVELQYPSGQSAYASEATGTMGTDTVGVCAVTVKTDAPWPGTSAAQISASSILRRTLTRGAPSQFTALAAWWVRPGDTITRPDGTRALVARVRFTYPDSLMTITTREAD